MSAGCIDLHNIMYVIRRKKRFLISCIKKGERGPIYFALDSLTCLTPLRCRAVSQHSTDAPFCFVLLFLLLFFVNDVFLLLLLENCPVGTFFDIKEKSCVACPQDTYNPLTGQVGLCRLCPQGTFTVNNGSKNISQCLGMAFINWIVFDIKQRLIVRNCTPIKHLISRRLSLVTQ